MHQGSASKRITLSEYLDDGCHSIHSTFSAASLILIAAVDLVNVHAIPSTFARRAMPLHVKQARNYALMITRINQPCLENSERQGDQRRTRTHNRCRSSFDSQ
jgi:hypothetical protein